METKTNMKMIVREANKKDLEVFYQMLVEVDRKVRELKEKVEEHQDMLSVIWIDTKEILKPVVPILIDKSDSKPVDMVTLTIYMYDTIMIAENLIAQMEKTLRALKRTLTFWKSYMGLTGNVNLHELRDNIVTIAQKVELQQLDYHR